MAGVFYVQPRMVTRECWKANIGALPRTAPWARPFATAAGGNPKVFFECSIGGKPAGRIVFELFNDVVPKVREPPLSSTVHVRLRADDNKSS